MPSIHLFTSKPQSNSYWIVYCDLMAQGPHVDWQNISMISEKSYFPKGFFPKFPKRSYYATEEPFRAKLQGDISTSMLQYQSRKCPSITFNDQHTAHQALASPIHFPNGSVNLYTYSNDIRRQVYHWIVRYLS